MKQTKVGMGVLGPGSFFIPCDLTCEMCKKSSSSEGTLVTELAAGEVADFAIKTICLECGHTSHNLILR